MTPDAYRDFAGRYDLFFEEFGRHRPAEMDFFRQLFADNDVGNVLDCACGTGHDLVMLASLGVRVTGSDISGSMLEQARDNLAGCGVQVPLAQVDYRELPDHFSECFDAVLCLSTSLLEAGDKGEIQRALQSMNGVLCDNGILVLSQGTTDKQWRARPRFIPVVNRPDFSRIIAIDYLARGARYSVLDLFHGADRRELVVWSREYPIMLLKDDYEALLRAAGFHDLRFYGDYAFSVYDKTRSDMLLVVARK
jgi:ubiquinone/menaquinone biosynthesis C-methylase UbiE